MLILASPLTLMSLLRFYIVRHGETEANKRQIIQGHLDTELNEEGLTQACKTADILENVPFIKAFSSDLSRAAVVSYLSRKPFNLPLKLTVNQNCPQTAEIILRQHPGVPLKKDVKLRERVAPPSKRLANCQAHDKTAVSGRAPRAGNPTPWIM